MLARRNDRRHFMQQNEIKLLTFLLKVEKMLLRFQLLPEINKITRKNVFQISPYLVLRFDQSCTYSVEV